MASLERNSDTNSELLASTFEVTVLEIDALPDAILVLIILHVNLGDACRSTS